MPWVLGVQEAGEAEHGHEPVVPLGLGGCGRRPVDNRLRDHMRLATRRGKAGEAAEIGFGGFELKADRAAHGQIGLDRCDQHWVTSGHGLTTSWSSCRSTLA